SFKELKDAHAKDPDDPDVAARLADALFERGLKADARKTAEAALAKKANHPLASYVKARLLRDAGDEEQALSLLRAGVDRKDPEVKVLELLGKMQFEAKKFAEAAETYELARRAEPYENRWLTELARVYLQAGEPDKEVAVLKELAPTDADDLAT